MVGVELEGDKKNRDRFYVLQKALSLVSQLQFMLVGTYLIQDEL